MIYCLATTLYYMVCTEQPAYGVSAQLLLLGIVGRRIHLPLLVGLPVTGVKACFVAECKSNGGEVQL